MPQEVIIAILAAQLYAGVQAVRGQSFFGLSFVYAMHGDVPSSAGVLR